MVFKNPRHLAPLPAPSSVASSLLLFLPFLTSHRPHWPPGCSSDTQRSSRFGVFPLTILYLWTPFAQWESAAVWEWHPGVGIFFISPIVPQSHSPSPCALKRNEGRASPVTAIRSRLEEHQSITPQQILHFAHKHTNWDISIWKAVLVNLKDTCKLKNIKFILKNTRKRVCIGIHFAMHINNKNTCSTFYLSQLNFWPTWSPQKGKIPGPQSAEPGTWQANMCNVHPRLDPPDSRQRLVNKGAPTRRKIKGLLLSDDLSESSRLLICSLSS